MRRSAWRFRRPTTRAWPRRTPASTISAPGFSAESAPDSGNGPMLAEEADDTGPRDLDGVFTEEHGGALAFHPAPAPTDAEVAAALATIRHRVQRLLVRRGLEPGDDATGPADRLAEESPVLAGIVGASVQGRVALGPRAGARGRRRGGARGPAGREAGRARGAPP